MVSRSGIYEPRTGACHLVLQPGRAFVYQYIPGGFDYDLFRGFTLLATFRYNQSKVDLKGQGLVDRPLTSKYKGC